MKKSLLLLSFLLAGATAATAQKAKPKPKAKAPDVAYFNCTIDGKAYTTTDKTAYTTTKHFTNDEPPYMQVSIGTAFDKAISYSINFYLPEDQKMLKPGKYPLGNVIAYEHAPAAYFSLDEGKGEAIRFFNSSSPEEGTVEITSVTGNLVEGTFAVTLPELGGTGKRTVTNGTFKFWQQPVER